REPERLVEGAGRTVAAADDPEAGRADEAIERPRRASRGDHDVLDVGVALGGDALDGVVERRLRAEDRRDEREARAPVPGATAAHARAARRASCSAATISSVNAVHEKSRARRRPRSARARRRSPSVRTRLSAWASSAGERGSTSSAASPAISGRLVTLLHTT